MGGEDVLTSAVRELGNCGVAVMQHFSDIVRKKYEADITDCQSSAADRSHLTTA